MFGVLNTTEGFNIDWEQRIQNALPKNHSQLLLEVTYHGKEEHVRYLLSKGALIVQLGENQETALHAAAKLGMKKKLKLLLSVATSVEILDSSGKTPMNYAAEKGHDKCHIMLLNHKKLNPSSDPCLDLFERIHAAPKKNYSQLLLEATLYGKEEHIRYLLTAGAPIVQIGPHKETALHIAAKHGKEQAAFS